MVLGTEFGRTPRINDNDGGDYHNSVRYLLAGAGIRDWEAKRDTHSDNFEGTPRQTTVPDQAMSALLGDLPAKGLLEQTLEVLGTEFGRTPRINDNDGRDSHDEAFRCLLAGAGIEGGKANGGADGRGATINHQGQAIWSLRQA